ncbi:MAG: methyl-accepting chemotaxis protein, partial [Methylococcaceae bacterium]|nr:methyl-accepting chemotaxis protein [Methylococcaceae bacterium]
MESAIPAHDRFDRFIRSAKPPGDAIELVRDLITSLAEIEEQSVRVRSIAAEVNLLAVNASLEASRAGETGRGFSIFADCMRRLS